MTDEELIERAFQAHEGVPTWEDDPVGRDAAIRWHMRGFHDALAVFREHTAPEGHERTPIYDGNEHVCSGCVNSEGNNVAWDQAEHTAPRYADSAEVMAAAEKIAGENRELLERLAGFGSFGGLTHSWTGAPQHPESRREAPAEPAVTSPNPHADLIAEAGEAILTMDYERAYQGGLVDRLADALEANLREKEALAVEATLEIGRQLGFRNDLEDRIDKALGRHHSESETGVDAAGTPFKISWCAECQDEAFPCRTRRILEGIDK